MIWTAQQVKTLTENWLNFTVPLLGKMVGKSEQAVRKKLRALELFLPPTIANQRKVDAMKKGRETINQQRQKRISENQVPKEANILVGVYLQSLSIKRRYQNKKPQLHEILLDVCDALGIPMELAKSKTRKREVTNCRKIYCYVARKIYPSKSHKDIGLAIGYKEHSMSIHCIQDVQGALDVQDPVFLKYWNHYLTNTKIYNK